jgi:CheY-like chemotaxis protein
MRTQDHFDAIIMDVEMPIMNGWEAVQEIRALRNGRQIPIIMFTAYGDSEYHDRALSLGANDLWRKPLLPQEVLVRLESIMS